MAPGNPLRTRREFLGLFGTPNANAEALVDIREGIIPNYPPDVVFAVVGDAETVLVPPDGSLFISILVEFESFSIRVGDQIPRVVVVDGAQLLSPGGHGYSPVDGPVLISTTGTLPKGVDPDVLYFLQKVNPNIMNLHTSRESAEAGDEGKDKVIIEDLGAGVHTVGGFSPEATSTDLDVGYNIITLNAGTGLGTSQILPVFQSFRARTLTVKGATSNSRLKCVMI